MKPIIYRKTNDLAKKELVFCINATQEGYTALRSKQDGGYLINGLKNVITENSLANSSGSTNEYSIDAVDIELNAIYIYRVI